MDPITREEQLMAGEQLEPITRKEYFLAKAAGMDVETPEPITREEMFLSMISGGGTGGSGGADWNASEGEPGYVKNRTHYEETVVVNEPLNITCDGNTDGLVCVADQIFKVSDLVLTDEQIKKCFVTINVSNDPISIGSIWDDLVSFGFVTNDWAVFLLDEAAAVFFIRKDDTVIEFESVEYKFPKRGIYFLTYGEIFVTSLTTTEPIEQTKTVVHPIDKKYLPDDVGGGGGVFVVDLMYQEDSTYTTSATAEELATAYEEGKTLYANINDGHVYPLSAIYYAASVRFTFAGVNMYAGSAPYYEAFTIKDSTVTVNKFTLTEVT